MKFSKWIYFLIIFIFIMNYTVKEVYAQESKGNPELDKKVMDFLKVRKNSWQDMNVPTSDGQLLFDIIVKNNYKKAIEIGTSTGHSGIWIARGYGVL